VTSVANYRRQGVGLYYNWLSNRSTQEDSTSDVRRIRGRRSRDVTTVRDDVTQRYGDVASKSDFSRWMRDHNPPGGRRIRRLDPLIQDPSPQPQQQERLPRQRRRHRLQMTSRTSVDDKKTTSRGYYTSRGVPVTSRAALGDVTTFLTTSRDLSRPQHVPVTSSVSPLMPVTHRRNDDDPTWWSKSLAAGNGADWNVPGLLESPGRMSCFQMELIEERNNISLVQVNPIYMYLIMYYVHLYIKPNINRRRRRDSSVELSRIGV